MAKAIQVSLTPRRLRLEATGRTPLGSPARGWGANGKAAKVLRETSAGDE